jgi:hypothetical protein
MKPYVNLQFEVRKFKPWLNAGWYWGEEFKLFEVSLFQCLADFSTGKIDQVTFFHIQVAKLMLAFGINLY